MQPQYKFSVFHRVQNCNEGSKLEASWTDAASVPHSALLVLYCCYYSLFSFIFFFCSWLSSVPVWRDRSTAALIIKSTQICRCEVWCLSICSTHQCHWCFKSPAGIIKLILTQQMVGFVSICTISLKDIPTFSRWKNIKDLNVCSVIKTFIFDVLMGLGNCILLYTFTAHNGKQKALKRFICLKHREWGEKPNRDGEIEV